MSKKKINLTDKFKYNYKKYSKIIIEAINLLLFFAFSLFSIYYAVFDKSLDLSNSYKLFLIILFGIFAVSTLNSFKNFLSLIKSKSDNTSSIVEMKLMDEIKLLKKEILQLEQSNNSKPKYDQNSVIKSLQIMRNNLEDEEVAWGNNFNFVVFLLTFFIIFVFGIGTFNYEFKISGSLFLVSLNMFFLFQFVKVRNLRHSCEKRIASTRALFELINLKNDKVKIPEELYLNLLFEDKLKSKDHPIEYLQQIKELKKILK